jgi:hypothetical protein
MRCVHRQSSSNAGEEPAAAFPALIVMNLAAKNMTDKRPP